MTRWAARAGLCRRRERGSALVLALLVTFILTLLGTSFLMMAQTESRIAHNERLAAQARYVAEAGVLAVKGWFDRPDTALGFPDPTEIDRTQRGILDETNPYGAVLGTDPDYKEDVDLDGDGLDDVFRRPFRGSEADALMGTPAQPDVVIDDQGSAAEASFLAELTSTLVGEFPATQTNLVARISRIAVYAPPYLRSGANWTRMGIATVQVTARIYHGEPAQVAAQQSVTVTLNEIPYGTPIFGPLHTGGSLTIDGPAPLHWGTVTASGPIEFEGHAAPDDVTLIRRSVRRGVSASRLEPLWTTLASDVAAYRAACEGQDIDDPWIRIIGLQAVRGPDPLVAEPDPVSPWQPWKNWSECAERSNVIAEEPLVKSPEYNYYDYDFWKQLARSGASGVHYYVPVGGENFREEGTGASQNFQTITQAAAGLYFFDTLDGLAPHDDDGDGAPDNLTGAIDVVGAWNPRGFVYLDSERLSLAGLTPGPATTLRAPGEPFLDSNADGAFTPGVEEWINLDYPDDLADPARFAQNFEDDLTALIPSRTRRGPPLAGAVNLHGILFTAGKLSLAGPQGRVHGGLVARGDVDIDGASFLPGEGVFWDASIGEDWPPPELGLPLTVITRWDSTP